VRDVLSPEEQRRVEDVDERVFSWKRRFELIAQRVSRQAADVVSLVELDAFEELQRRLADDYEGAFAPRPRQVSKDGCALFWRRKEFRLLHKRAVVFTDWYKHKAAEVEDRTALLTLLETRSGAPERLVLASTHLVRDSHTTKRDGVRARQLTFFAANLLAFCRESNTPLDTPVVLCGDLNATSLAKLQGMVLASALLSSVGGQEQRVHPFVFQAQPVLMSGSTSWTEERNVRIDTILYSSLRLDARALVPLDVGPPRVIPDERMPSDHFPLLAELTTKPVERRATDAARRWWTTVLQLAPAPRPGSETAAATEAAHASCAAGGVASDGLPMHTPSAEAEAWKLDVQMDAHELALAFHVLDVDGDGVISERDARGAFLALRLGELSAHAPAGLAPAAAPESEAAAETGEAGESRGLPVRGPPVPATIAVDEEAAVRRAVASGPFLDFCASYYAVHPICAQCATAAFDQMDKNRDGKVSVEELEKFFEPFERSPFHCDAKALLSDAALAGFCSKGAAFEDGSTTLEYAQFRSLLGAKFVELAFEPDLAREIERRMRR